MRWKKKAARAGPGSSLGRVPAMLALGPGIESASHRVAPFSTLLRLLLAANLKCFRFLPKRMKTV